eukprot:5632591-Amphidinium_carterae.1
MPMTSARPTWMLKGNDRCTRSTKSGEQVVRAHLRPLRLTWLATLQDHMLMCARLSRLLLHRNALAQVLGLVANRKAKVARKKAGIPP